MRNTFSFLKQRPHKQAQCPLRYSFQYILFRYILPHRAQPFYCREKFIMAGLEGYKSHRTEPLFCHLHKCLGLHMLVDTNFRRFGSSFCIKWVQGITIGYPLRLYLWCRSWFLMCRVIHEEIGSTSKCTALRQLHARANRAASFWARKTVG